MVPPLGKLVAPLGAMLNITEKSPSFRESMPWVKYVDGTDKPPDDDTPWKRGSPPVTTNVERHLAAIGARPRSFHDGPRAASRGGANHAGAITPAGRGRGQPGLGLAALGDLQGCFRKRAIAGAQGEQPRALHRRLHLGLSVLELGLIRRRAREAWIEKEPQHSKNESQTTHGSLQV
jgi:hypothetical protein